VKRALLLVLCSTALGADIPNADLDVLLDAGHFLRVKASIEPAFQTHPDDSDTAYHLSKAELALGNLDLSLKLAEAAVALDGSRADYHVQLAAACGRLAQTSSLFKQFAFAKRAKKELDVALELKPDSLDALYGLALFYYAAPSFMGGDKRKAQDAADKMTGLHPARGYLTQAKLANEKKDPAAEETFYKKSLEADPQFYEAKATLANFYLTRDISAARQQALEAAEIDPTRVEAWKVLAQVYIATQCWDELLLLLERARKEDSDNLSYYYTAALALEDSGQFLNWASNFISIYKNVQPEGNEPTLAEAEKVARRINDRLAVTQSVAGLR
jgi:cytochrome c-type biogenesis protein CcmH/NrfG